MSDEKKKRKVETGVMVALLREVRKDESGSEEELFFEATPEFQNRQQLDKYLRHDPGDLAGKVVHPARLYPSIKVEVETVQKVTLV